MPAWHVDLILDLDWIVAHGGTTVQPKAGAQRLDEQGRPVVFYVYGDGEAISHLRVLFEADSDEEALAILNANAVLWREAMTVTSVITTSHYAAAAVLGANSSAHMVWLRQGDVETPFIQLTLQMAKPIPADYMGAAALMAGWPSSLAIHFHFLARFLNPNLPVDIRWLQGYRFLEWHFERGGANLQRNTEYRAFLDTHGASLDSFKRSGQPRYGFMEETRALMAHALLADRSSEEEQARAQNSATNTFPTLEAMVITVLNEIAPEGMQFKPKPPLEAPEMPEAAS